MHIICRLLYSGQVLCCYISIFTVALLKNDDLRDKKHAICHPNTAQHYCDTAKLVLNIISTL
jgi:hypothetical protein